MESSIIFVSFFTCLTVCMVAVDGTSYDSRIDNFLNTYLPKKHRPLIWEDTVYVFAELYNIIAINEKKETIMTKLWNYISYVVDVPEEAWNNLTDTYMYEFYPGKDSIWKPDIIVLNTVEVEETSFEDPIVQRAYTCPNTTYCYTSGALVVYPFAQTQITTCSFDVTSFPFDNQKCRIEIGPWFTDITTYTRDEYGRIGPYKIRHPNPDVTSMSLESFEKNTQWDLDKVCLTYETRSAEHDISKDFDVMIYTLELARKPAFYVYTLVIPCLLLTLLVVLSIYLPVDSGEKMGLGVTIMLAQVVNLFILSGLIPTSSEYFPELGYYFLVTIGLIGISLIYNTININFYYYNYGHIFKAVFKKGGAKASKDDDLITPKTLDESIEVLGKLVEEIGGDESDESEGKRRQNCIVMDHIFGTVMLLVILIVTGIFFLPEI